MGFFVNVVNKVTNTIKKVVSNIRAEEQALLDSVTSFEKNLASDFASLGGTVVADLKNIATTIADGALLTNQALISRAAMTVTTLFNDLPPLVTQMVTGPAAYRTNNLTPTVGQFTAAALEIVTNPFAAPPSLEAFRVNGQQMRVRDDASGLYGQAWMTASRQVIVTFMATNPISPFGLDFYEGERRADVGILRGDVTATQTEALAFTRAVQSAASAQGINAQTGVFTTGMSLGGDLAEYCAQQTGIGGLGIVSPGIRRWSGQGSGANFVNVLAAGDPVSQLDENFNVDPAFLTRGLTHYGLVMQTGPQAANTLLSSLSNVVLAQMPTNVDPYEYITNSFLAAATVTAGDLSGLNYMSPAQLAFGAYSGANHVLGTLPTLLANANSTLPQFISANHLA